MEQRIRTALADLRNDAAMWRETERNNKADGKHRAAERCGAMADGMERGVLYLEGLLMTEAA